MGYGYEISEKLLFRVLAHLEDAVGLFKMNIPERYWRVFYTKSNYEKKCEDYIIAQNVEVFLPLIKSIRIYRGRKIKKKEPLFKNYIFACVNEKRDCQY
ncbi:MAG: transcription termination/antitermination NusG family protein [Bacteroidetes bacterium]|nr:transcription termination/antitermination NusG family protein [Bacteroidota bacterium]